VAWKVAWTEVAWSDVSAVADYIAKDSSRYAAAFVHEVREAACSLAEFAERGRVVPELRDPKVRELFVRNYRLIYRLTDRDVFIIAFIHGARHLESLWGRKRQEP
jgi:plasmid stabilization system protein ParE